MRRLRCASFEDYVRWYLRRERTKRRQQADLGERSWISLLNEMRGTHPDKLRTWFERAKWSIVLLEDPEEALSLVCVDGPDTRRNGLVTGMGVNHRIARAVVSAAREFVYFDNEVIRRTNAVEWHFRQDSLEAYRRNWPRFEGANRLVLCTLNEDERSENPAGNYYLHDGFGRLLPWLYAIVYEQREYAPIEAFLAEENRADGFIRRSAPWDSP